MSLLYNLVGLIFIVAFLMLLFLIAWYVALPLLIIGLFVWLFQQLTASVQHRPHFVLKRQKRKKTPAEKIIDVEWTEV